MLTVEEEIDVLVEAGLLTERQATAYVHREVELTPRTAAAEAMGISPNTLDNYRADANQKVEAARETLDAIETIRNQLSTDD